MCKKMRKNALPHDSPVRGEVVAVLPLGHPLQRHFMPIQPPPGKQSEKI